MSGPPKTLDVQCPRCEAIAVAVIPSDSTIVDREDDSDGKVWVDCGSCDERFLVYYRTDT